MSEGSLWESLLRDSSKRSKVSEGVVVIAGDDSTGKTCLASALSTGDDVEATSTKQSVNLPTYIVISDGDNATDKGQSNDDFVKLHGWILNDKTVDPFGKIILQNVSHAGNAEFCNAAFVITLDLTAEIRNSIAQLNKWVRILLQQYSAHVPRRTRCALARANARYVDAAQSHRGNAALCREEAEKHAAADGAEDGGDNGDNDDDCDNGGSASSQTASVLPFPLVVVGCKADRIAKECSASSQMGNRMKELQAYIRFVCMELGASYVVTNASAGASESDSSSGAVNVNLLRTYLLHRMSPETISMPAADMRVQDGLCSAFIPAGLDSPDLVALTCSHVAASAAEGDGGAGSGAGAGAVTPLFAALHEQYSGRGTEMFSLRAVMSSAVRGGLESASSSSSSSSGSGSGSGNKADGGSTGSGGAVEETKATTAQSLIEDEQGWLDGLHAQYVVHSKITGGSKVAAASASANSSAPTSGTNSRRGVSPTMAAGAAAGASDAEPSPTATAATATAAPNKPLTRRASMRMQQQQAAAGGSAAGAAAGQDPADFFKNLLISGPAKK